MAEVKNELVLLEPSYLGNPQLCELKARIILLLYVPGISFNFR